MSTETEIKIIPHGQTYRYLECQWCKNVWAELTVTHCPICGFGSAAGDVHLIEWGWKGRMMCSDVTKILYPPHRDPFE